MKNVIIRIYFVLIMLICIFIPAAAEGTVSVKLIADKSTVRPNETITVSVSLSGVASAGGVAAGGVNITYDTSKLTYQSAAIAGGKPASDLDINLSGNTLQLLYFDNQGGANGFAADGTMATIKFVVNSNVQPCSTDLSVSADGFGNKTAQALSATTTGMNLTIAAPYSTNANLSNLSVSNATISPAFSKGTTTYTAEVPFSITKLEITAAAEDSTAKVSISNPALTASGTTNVTVTVTAESGTKQTYTIKVKRAQDPNYQASTNNNLSSITIDGFLLSPLFNADLTNYVVWLPYETASVKVSGTAADAKAQGVEIVGGQDLLAGQDNTVKVICTAENGDKKEYIVVVKRAAAHDGTVDEMKTESTNSTEVEESSETDIIDTNTNSAGSPIWLTTLLVIIGLGIGFAGGFFVNTKLKRQ